MPGYLDHNATTPMKPAVKAAMTAAFDLVGNASSVHRYGRDRRRAMEAARDQVAALIGVEPGGVIFTSGGTEANNLALAGGDALASAIEHDSVRAVTTGHPRVPVGPNGVIDLSALDGLAATCRPRIIALMLVNNETGVVQPVAEAAGIAHRHGALLHCDAVQAPGRLRLDFAALDVDSLAISAHKLGGPQGVGALAVRPGLMVAPLLRGGGQERRQRAGTENVAGIVGFGAAAALAGEDLAATPRVAELRDRLEAGIRRQTPGAVIFGAGAERVANTSCFAIPDVPSELQVMALDLAGLAVGAGAACSSGKVGVSHVLTAMGVDCGLAECAIRVSFGWDSVAADGERLLAVHAALCERRRKSRTAA